MSNITTYLVSASLILLVIRQIRELPMELHALDTQGTYQVTYSARLESTQRDAVLVARAREGLI